MIMYDEDEEISLHYTKVGEHTCKYCKEHIKLEDHEVDLLNASMVGDYSEHEPDEGIGAARLDISTNPVQWAAGYGETEVDECLFYEELNEMCVNCKNELLNEVKLLIYKWKSTKGVM